MHIGNETRAVLATRPHDFRNLLNGIPDVFPQVPIRGSEEAQREVADAEKAIIDRFGDGAELVDHGPVPYWRIGWEADWWMLVGNVYLDRGPRRGYDLPDKLDPTSPLVLLHRSRNKVYYGEELVPLATRVIAHSLAYQALRADPLPLDE